MRVVTKDSRVVSATCPSCGSSQVVEFDVFAESHRKRNRLIVCGVLVLISWGLMIPYGPIPLLLFVIPVLIGIGAMAEPTRLFGGTSRQCGACNHRWRV